MVIISVSNTFAHITNLDSVDVIDVISSQLSYKEPGYRYQPKYRMGGWDGSRRLLSRTLKFPPGLVQRVCTILDGQNIQYELKWVSDSSQIHVHPIPYSGPTLRPHQVEIVSAAMDNKIGIIKSPTGSGKSYAIAGVVGARGVQTVVYVISLELLTQMKDTIEEALGVEVGVVGGGKCIIRNITVCSVWTAGLACGKKLIQSDDDGMRERWSPSQQQRSEIAAMVREAKCIILDEAQFAAATTIQIISKESVSAIFRYGFTATPWRTGGDDILLEAAFGNKICDISASELIEAGFLALPRIVFRDIPKYNMPIDKTWNEVKYKYINNNDVRNMILINNALKLLEMDRKPLMLYRDLSHGERLADLFPNSIRVELVSGKTKRSSRDGVKDRFESGQTDIIIASTIYDQGVDIKELDALLPCAGGKSTGRALQRVGRVIRSSPGSNKKDAIIIETFDQTHFTREHSALRYDIYRSESAFIVKVGEQMQKFLAKRGG